eukprot:gene14067-biopygen21611
MESCPPPPSRDHQFQTAQTAAAWWWRAHRLFGRTAMPPGGAPESLPAGAGAAAA